MSNLKFESAKKTLQDIIPGFLTHDNSIKLTRSFPENFIPERLKGIIKHSDVTMDGKKKRKSRKSKKRRSIKKSSGKKGNTIILQKSTKSDKKFMVTIGNKTVHFGAKGYSDYTKHKNRSRMHRYETRHRSRENWKKSGLETAGFWSKWILWNKPGLIESIRDTERRFGIKIQYRK